MVISKKKDHLVIRPRWTEFTIGCRLWWRPLEDDSILGLPIPDQLFPNPPLCKYNVTSFDSRGFDTLTELIIFTAAKTASFVMAERLRFWKINFPTWQISISYRYAIMHFITKFVSK